MSSVLIAAVLGTGGLGAIIGAIITGLSSRKKLGAEATEIITNAAAGVVKNLQGEIERQVKVNAGLVKDHHDEREDWKLKMQALIDSHDLEMQEVRRVLQ